MSLTVEQPDRTELAPVPHPLEPLRPDEIAAAAAVLRADPRFAEGTRFVFLMLEAPDKSVVRAFTPGSAWDRRVAALLRGVEGTDCGLVAVGEPAGHVDHQVPVALVELLLHGASSQPSVARSRCAASAS